MNKTYLAVAIALAFLTTGAYCAPDPPNNPFGVMVMTDGDADSAGMLHHLELARDMVGEWGYVRVGAGLDESSVPSLVRLLLGCRALHLIPVVTAMRLPASYYDPGNRDIPRKDADGSLTSFENAYESWARRVYEAGVTIPYFEYGNEVNGGFFGEHPEVYGQSLIAASRGLKKVDPKISFGTAGMAGCARDFYDKLLTRLPEVKDHVDHWGFHPYAANHPPGYGTSEDDYSVECHKFLAATLASHGVKSPVLIASETGFELGNQRDRRFPKITEEVRARYLVEAYQKHWLPDPHVRAIMPFMLQDVRWSNWNGWDFIRDDYSLTPMYQAIRDLAKPRGSDFLAAGRYSVTGRITCAGAGLEDVIVWIRAEDGPGHYAAVSGADGSFRVDGVPTGTYTISAFRDGYKLSGETKVQLSEGASASWNLTAVQTGYLRPFDAGSARVPAGWTSVTEDDVYQVDTSITRAQAPSVRIEANGREQGIWQVTAYESVIPGRAYQARVWVRASSEALHGPKTATLALSAADSYNRTLGSVSVPLVGGVAEKWTELTALIRPQPRARRLRVNLTTGADSGTVWFADPFCAPAGTPWQPEPGEADAISGIVVGEDGQKRLGGATVFLSPDGAWTTTDDLGQFRLGSPAASGSLVASAPGYASSASAASTLARPATVQLRLPEVPAALVDPGFENVPKISSWFSGWGRWGTTEGVHAAGSFKGLPEHPEGFQPHSGNGFYGAVAGSNIKDGGIYQTIAAEPNALYEVSVWSYTFQTGEGGIRGDATNRLGVDPSGGQDPNSPYVIWTPHRPSHKEWSKVSLRVRPVGARFTVFLHHQQVVGLLYVCNLFDDVSVQKIGPPEETLNSDR